MPLAFAEPNDNAIPIHVVEGDGLDAVLADLPTQQKAWAKAQGFRASLGQILLLPDANGAIEAVLVGYGDASKRARGRFHMGAAAAKLPLGDYLIASGLTGDGLEVASRAWLLAGYS